MWWKPRRKCALKGYMFICSRAASMVSSHKRYKVIKNANLFVRKSIRFCKFISWQHSICFGSQSSPAISTG